MGLLSRLKQRLNRTRGALSDGISGLFKGGRGIDQALLEELEELTVRQRHGHALCGKVALKLLQQGRGLQHLVHTHGLCGERAVVLGIRQRKFRTPDELPRHREVVSNAHWVCIKPTPHAPYVQHRSCA